MGDTIGRQVRDLRSGRAETVVTRLMSDLLARLVVAFLGACLTTVAAPQPTHWVVSWGTSASPPPDVDRARAKGLEFNNQTVREIVHLSLGGPEVRVRFSNAFGSQGLEIGAAHVALRAGDSAIQPFTDRALTFGGAAGVTVPPNAFVLSDPVKLAAPAGSDLAISIFVPHAATAAGMHYLAQQTSYAGAGDQTAASSIADAHPLETWVFLAGVDVSAPSAAAVAVFGDSRVDGDGSTPNSNHRWPDVLARRLSQKGIPLGVLNAGIIGNRILHDAPKAFALLGVNGLSRFDRDALDQPGVKYVILLQGIVDIGLPGTDFAPASEAVTVEELIAGLKQLIVRAHERGMKVFVATQTPFSGATSVPGMFSPEKELKRRALNQWIRSSHDFDGLLDFDKVLLDPTNPERIRPQWDCGDHIHPNDAGYEAMANSVDLAIFR